MKKATILFSLILILVCSRIIAQQEQQHAQFMINGFVLNPAMAGTEDFIDLKVGYRKQWTGLRSSPRTTYITGHSTLGKKFSNAHNHVRGEHQYWHGVGGYIYDDKTGPISRTTFMMSYALNMPLSKDLRVSIGAFFGAKNFKFDPTGYEVADEGDFLINTYNIMRPDGSLGVWLYSKDFFLGTSVFQIFNNTLDMNGFYDAAGNNFNGDKNQLKRHYFVTGGFRVPLSYNLNFVPSFAVKALYPAPLSIDLNGKFDLNDQFWAGLSYRYRDAFTVMAGTLLFRQLEVSYSYGLTHSSLRNANYGSHEIILGYRFKHPHHIDCPSSFW